MKPYEGLPDTVAYKDGTYKIDLSYAAFFAACDLLKDEKLSDLAKLEGALDILCEDAHPVEAELLSAILRLVEKPRKTGDEQKVMDIEQDWNYICAAFQQAYGIDLYGNKEIHINRFLSLLVGIPKGTKFADIIGIRSAKIPAPNKHNQQEIAELTRLKTIYALKGNETSLQSGWERLFNMLEARAKNGKGRES